MNTVQCPRCGKQAEQLQSLDERLIAKLKEGGGEESPPPQVCMNCFTQLAGSVARGSVLLAREKAREQKKLILWKNRVNLIKKARILMGKKAYAEAVVQYEKYIKVLELVFESEPGGLAPEHFKDSARTQELTVVASVYWDLLRIYDTSPKYAERQNMAAKKLAQFLRFTPIYPDILRKAEIFVKAAKNPAIIKQFIKAAGEGKSRCFIATATFDSPFAPEVISLQMWRDRVLLSSASGRGLNCAYYLISPYIAQWIDHSPLLKKISLVALKKMIQLIEKSD